MHIRPDSLPRARHLTPVRFTIGWRSRYVQLPKSIRLGFARTLNSGTYTSQWLLRLILLLIFFFQCQSERKWKYIKTHLILLLGTGLQLNRWPFRVRFQLKTVKTNGGIPKMMMRSRRLGFPIKSRQNRNPFALDFRLFSWFFYCYCFQWWWWRSVKKKRGLVNGLERPTVRELMQDWTDRLTGLATTQLSPPLSLYTLYGRLLYFIVYCAAAAVVVNGRYTSFRDPLCAPAGARSSALFGRGTLHTRS